MIDKRLYGLPGFRGTMGLLAVLSFVQGIAIVGQSYGLTEALVRIWQLRTLSALPIPVGIFALSFALRQCAEVGKQRIGTQYADRTISRLRPRVQRKLFVDGPSALAGRGTGATVTMIIDGLDQTKTYIQTVLPKILDMGLIPLIILAVVWSQNWLSGLVLLLVLPLLIFFMAILGLAARDKANRQYGEFRMLNNRFVDTILGLPTLKMLGVADAYEDEIFTVSDRFRKRTMSVIVVAMTSTFALDFFTTLSIAIVAVLLGNNLINGSIALFPALFTLILAPEYFLPIRQFGNDYHATLNGKNAMNDIMTVLDDPEPEPEHNDAFAWNGWRTDSTLTLRHVDFCYPDAEAPHANGTAVRSMGGSKSSRAVAPTTTETTTEVASDRIVKEHAQLPALHDISVDLHGLQNIAIVGRSGAGKSTLINLLAGFDIPRRGEIKLDGTAMMHLNAPSWQRHISYIPQTPYIFHGTIADNIRFYRPTANDHEVRQAAEEAGLRDWIATLPQGLGTPIGEGNRGISGGQAQRIALARVILDDSREILLFDEPTAHLDIETEYDLKRTLLRVMQGHLVVIATHRLHWLDDMDQVIVMDRGGIVEIGEPSELIGHGGALDDLIAEMGGNQIDGYRVDDHAAANASED